MDAAEPGRSGRGLFGEYVVKWSGEGVAAEPLAQVNRYVTSRRTTGLITCRSRGPVVRGAVMGDLRMSQPSDRPTCSAKIFDLFAHPPGAVVARRDQRGLRSARPSLGT